MRDLAMTERPSPSQNEPGVRGASTATKRQRAFAHRLSHALRGDITTLQLALSVARQRVVLPHETAAAEDPFAPLEAAIAQLKRRDLDLSRLIHAEAGSLEVTRASQRLRWVVEDVAHEYRTMASKHHVRLAVELGDCDAISLALDRELIVRALGAVLDNAIRFSPMNDIVTIHAETRGSMARITVRDQGVGFAPGDGRRVFRPFEVGGEGGSSSTGRLGMGLAVARAIVVAHGGHIHIARAKRPGGAVVIELPLM